MEATAVHCGRRAVLPLQSSGNWISPDGGREPNLKGEGKEREKELRGLKKWLGMDPK